MNHRREIADRVIAKWRALGVTLDAVPDWMSLVELWIDGAIDGGEMHRRYLAALQARADARNAQRVQETRDQSDIMTTRVDPDAETIAGTPGPSD